ncbi:MAG: hypothetical protein IT435_04200 [Phycisphaerales bacterium]|nr:hypothetical protein [Phycisphaerales bacterium]
MHCPTCNYTLWNIRNSTCPECGAPFRISDFTFNPNSVQFRCPHCDQSYYGTEPRTGHLIPPEFDCVGCHKTIRMDDMVLLPTEGIREDQTKGEKNPWLEARSLSLTPWIRTVYMSCFSPIRLIDATLPQLPVRRAWSFLIQTVILTALTGIGAIALFVLVVNYGASGPGISVIIELATGAGITTAIIAAATIFWLLSIHGLLMITGPAKTLAHSTLAMCFSAGPLVVGAIPCLGVYTIWPGIVWWIINTTVLLAHIHKISAWRAVLATLTLPTLPILFLLATLFV